MVFTTHLFVFYFLPLAILISLGIDQTARAANASARTRTLALNGFLILASYLFYGWWDPRYILLMLAVTVVNHVCSRLISRPAIDPLARRALVWLALVVSLGTLGFFKYFVFAQTNLNAARGWLGLAPLQVIDVTLPIGISFYTFHALSYTLDVQRGTAPPVRSFLDFACYIALFPQLVAGPIIRYNTVADQLVSRSMGWEKFAAGVVLFVLGFAKKILLANPLGRAADAAFAAQALGPLDAWFGVLAYAFQIYFDFSGYSDMAIGLGRMLGFEFPRNFDAPYHSASITEFWRRWHISLSSFLRDYLYFPLGGNRKGPVRTYVNLLLVMLLGGLWHGAQWTFVAWGAFHGLMLAGERFLGKRSLYDVWPRPLKVGLTFGLVLVSWVLFRSDSLEAAGRYLGFMAGLSGSDPARLVAPALLYTRRTLLTMAACVLATAWPEQAHEWSAQVTWPKAVLVHPLFCASILAMFSQASNPFLYFQF